MRSITVSGFRGMGAAATLALQPGPGLTLVVGRNGSGKSSFADGLEVLLTGGLRDGKNGRVAWRDGWRNLHAPARFACRRTCSWKTLARRPPSEGGTRTGLADSHATVQVFGQSGPAGSAGLGGAADDLPAVLVPFRAGSVSERPIAAL